MSDDAITVQRSVPPAGVPAAGSLRRWARAVLPSGHGELTIRVVGEDEMTALNGDYRGRPRPTNVLSFEYPEDELLGDIAICAPVVAREAAEQGKSLRAHWAHLVIHGSLHLMGYDHQTDTDARVMEGLEREALSRLGYPDPYADPTP